MKWSSFAGTPAGESARPRWLLMVLAAVAVVGVGTSLLFPSARHQWALSIFRQPTRYTALSFNQAWALPSRAIVNEPIRISFTIDNQEGHTLNYRYILREAGPITPSRVLRSATKNIADGVAWSVSLVIHPSCMISPCRIEISLPGHPETIYFLVSLTGAKGQQPARKRYVRSN
jgi:hypothetical protein